MARSITVSIRADTREFRRDLLRAELFFTRSLRRRLVIRWRIWKIGREKAPWRERTP